jgi:hypothetical protein
MSETIADFPQPPQAHLDALFGVGEAGWTIAGGIGPRQARMHFYLTPGLSDLNEADMTKLSVYEEDGSLRHGFSVDYMSETDRTAISYRGAPDEALLDFLTSARALNPIRSHLSVTHEMLRDAFDDWIIGTYPNAKTIGDVVVAQFLTPSAEQSCSIA